MIGGPSLDQHQDDDCDAAATVNEELLSSGCDAIDDRRVGCIERGGDRAGPDDESRSERDVRSLFESSIGGPAPTTDDSESPLPSPGGVGACEDGDDNEISEKGEALGRSLLSRTESTTTESIPTIHRETSPSLAATPPQSESGDNSGSNRHIGRAVGPCSCPQDGRLTQPASNEEPPQEAGLSSRRASMGEDSWMDNVDQEFMKAAKLLNLLVEDSKSGIALEVALQSTQTRQEFGDRVKSSTDTYETSTRIVATLELLGDMCGRMDSL
jgi:hypothetical protein